MRSDLGFSETVYGLGAGMFFIGYFLFEVPSNMILHRVGARVWIARIMITWGIVSGAFMFVTTADDASTSLRFLLGIAEAGFFPGIILYLTYWFPRDRRAAWSSHVHDRRSRSSGIFGGPVSGWIMDASTATRAGGLAVAVPARGAAGVIVGVVVSSIWITGSEARNGSTRTRRRCSSATSPRTRAQSEPTARSAPCFADRRVGLMCLIYFTIVMGQYGLTFWMPTLIQAAGVRGTLKIGMFSAIPYGAGAIAMVFFGRSADRHRERRWHAASAMLIGAAGMTLSAIAGTHTALAILFLTIASTGVFSCAPLFWSLPTAFLSGAAAAAGIAAINSIGDLAGFVSPYVVGWLRISRRAPQAGMFAVSRHIVAGAAIILIFVPAKLVSR